MIENDFYQSHTLRFFFKFVSLAYCSKTHRPNESPRKQKMLPWKSFWNKNHPQTSLLLSRRGPRCPDARLSQYYISPKMICCNFSNFRRKKFPGFTKEISCTY
jgi:hypothetical protein